MLQVDNVRAARRHVWLAATVAPLTLAIAAPARTQAVEQAASDPVAVEGNVADIVVTASKRPESLLKAPQSVAALTGAQLERIGAQDFRDYANKIPSLNFNNSGGPGVRYNIRGVAALSAQNNDIATVGYYLDEIPLSEGSVGADVQPFDLERIEVLRGPQGTLYGEGSIGGTIRVITRKPDLTKVEGAGRAILSNTDHGGINYSLSAAANLPLVTDKIALRLVGTQTRESGFIDNVVTGDENTNRGDRTELRGMLRFAPDAATTIDLFGYYERARFDGRSFDFSLAGSTVPNTGNIAPALGQASRAPYGIRFTATPPFFAIDQNRIANTAPKYSSVFAFPERFDTDRYIANATINHDFGSVRLTSATSYYKLKHLDLFDNRADSNDLELTAAQLQLAGVLPSPPFFFAAQSGDVSRVVSRAEVFSQEVRLASDGSGPLRWVLGGFYRDRTNRYTYFQQQPEASQILGIGALFQAAQRVKFEQIAAFGDATFDITPELHLSGGFRVFREKVKGTGSVTILNDGFTAAVPLFAPFTFPAGGRQTQNEALFKASIAYDFTPDLHGYLLFSEGSRPGGVNQRLVTTFLPRFFRSDSTKNYEAGLKGALFDRRLTFAAALFQVDWNNTQVFIATPPGGQNIYNAPGGARVRGGELEVALNFDNGLSAGVNWGHLKAETRGPITFFNSRTAPTTGIIPSGQTLPDVPRDKLAGFVQYRAELGDGQSITARADEEYVASRLAALGASYRLGSYHRVNAQLTWDTGPISLTAFGTNLLDKRIETGASVREFVGVALDRPRTYGLRASTRF